MEQIIKERYVNLEVARLLRDKGFDEPCDNYYDQSSDEPQQLTLDEMYYSYDEFIKAPTQQMACDWMRTRNVLITYDLAPVGTALMVKVYKRVYDDPNFPWTEGITIIRDTLEDAINEALKYALEKLL